MDSPLRHLGIRLVCETCDGEIDLPEDLDSGTGVCRQCGIAFLVDAPYRVADGTRRSA